MTMEINNDFIYIQANETQAKKLDAVWVKSRNAWRVPNTLGALRELHQLGYDVLEYGKKKAEARERLLSIKEGGFYQVIDGLRPYQNKDISFLRQLPHAAIFNQQRTGKTPTTLKLIEAEGHEKAIVVCPASLVLNWKKEVERWVSNYHIHTVKGTKNQRQKIYSAWESSKGFLVLSYETLRSDVELIDSTNSVVVLDEAHRLRNYQSQQSKAVYKLGKNAAKRLALTGTPAVNKGDDLYGILHFLYPSKFPSYWQFVDRYFKTWETPWGVRQVSSYKRKEELQEILDLISVQRKRSEVMQWVPAKQYQTIEVEMSAKQSKAYKDMLETFTVIEETEIKADASSVLAQLTRLRQICLSPDLLDIQAPSAKEEFLLEWLDDNPNEQVIVFSSFSSYLKKLKQTLDSKKSDVSIIVGETPLSMRNKYVEWFQAGKTKVMLANIQAAGVGLTLDKASTVIFLDRAYTPTDNQQAEDRIVATTESSNQNSLIIDLVCKDSIDSKILDILNKKQSIIEVVNNYKNIKELMNN